MSPGQGGLKAAHLHRSKELRAGGAGAFREAASEDFRFGSESLPASDLQGVLGRLCPPGGDDSVRRLPGAPTALNETMC